MDWNNNKILKMKIKHLRILLIVATLTTQACIDHLPSQNYIEWTLPQVIRMAQDSVINAFRAQHNYQQQLWTYHEYEAKRGLQINLKLSPNYVRQRFLLSQNYMLQDLSNALSLNTEIRIDKQMNNWGGDIYIASQGMWSWLMNGSPFYGIGNNLMYSGTPIRIGYHQDLLGYNPYKWDKIIEEFHLERAANELVYQMAEISETAVSRFFALAQAQADYNMYLTNVNTSQNLYEIGKEKFYNTSIRKDELLSLELELRNSRNSLSIAKVTLDNCKHDLLSYLNMKDKAQDIRLVIPSNQEQIMINASNAIQQALMINPNLMEQQEHMLKEEKNLEYANKQHKWYRISLDLSFGMQQLHNYYASDPLRNYQYALSNASFTIPIFDNGLAESRVRKAKLSISTLNDEIDERERLLREDVLNTINNFHEQQILLKESGETMQLADKAFKLSQYNYANGLSDMNTFTLAQNRKDVAHNNYIKNLEQYWESYYRLCRLTLYDWSQKKPLKQDLNNKLSNKTER